MSDGPQLSPAAAALRAKCRSALNATDPQPTTVLQVREVINLVCEDVDGRIVAQLGDYYDAGAGTARADIAFGLHRERIARTRQQTETLAERAERWMETGQRVELGFATGSGFYGRGRVIAFADQPTVVVRLDSGHEKSWVARLVRETDQPAPATDRAAEQARIVAESVDLRNPDWRTSLAVDVAAALRGTRLDPLPDGHPAAVPADAPGDRDHTPCPHDYADTPGDDRGRELAELADAVRAVGIEVIAGKPCNLAELGRIEYHLRALAAPAETEVDRDV